MEGGKITIEIPKNIIKEVENEFKNIEIIYNSESETQKIYTPGKIFKVYNAAIISHLFAGNNLIVLLPIQNFYYIPLFALSMYYYFLGKTKNRNKSHVLVLSTRNKILENVYKNIVRIRKLNKEKVEKFAFISFSNNLSDLDKDFAGIIIDVANFSLQQLKKVLSKIKDDKYILFVSSFFNLDAYNLIFNEVKAKNLKIEFFGVNNKTLKEHINLEGRENIILRERSFEIPNSLLGKTIAEKIKKIEIVKDEYLNNQLKKCWENYYYIKNQMKDLESAINFAYIYKFAINYFEWRYLPSRILKKYISPYTYIANLDKIFERLRNLANSSGNEYLFKFILDLEKLDEMSESSGKVEIFKNIIKEISKSGNKILILTSSQQEKLALEEFLAEILPSELNWIDVYTTSYIFKVNDIYKWGLFPSFLTHHNYTRKAFSLITSPIIDNVVFIFYIPEYNYYNKVFSKILGEYNELTVIKSLKNFEKTKNLKKYEERCPPSYKKLSYDKAAKKAFELWDDIMHEILKDEEDFEISSSITKVKSITEKQIQLKIRRYQFKIENGEIICYYENEKIDILTTDYKIVRKKASDVNIGEHIIAYDNEFKKTRLEILLDKMKDNPKYKEYTKFIDIWRYRIAENLENTDYYHVLERLKKMGSEITDPTTIYAWKMGYVMGPRDYKDIYRIAKIFNDSILLTFWKNIATSMKKIRGLNIKAGRILSNTIRKLYEGYLENFSEIEIDKNLGITISDIAENIDIIRVIDKKVIE